MKGNENGKMTLEQAKMSGQSEGAGLLVITGIKTV